MAILTISFSAELAYGQETTMSSREILTKTRIACTSIPYEKGAPLPLPCIALLAMTNIEHLFHQELENIPWMIIILEFNQAIAIENKEQLRNMMDEACTNKTENLDFCDQSL